MSLGADASRNFVENLRGCGGRDENQEAKAQHGNSDCSAGYRVSVLHQRRPLPDGRGSDWRRETMKVSAEDFRRQYAGLSDEALLDVDRRDLVEVARKCYDEELARRQLKAPSPAAAASAPEPHEKTEEFVVAATYVSQEDARLANGLLQAAGIRAHLAAGGLALLVPVSTREDARDILAAQVSDE